jgi:hypothetical protein
LLRVLACLISPWLLLTWLSTKIIVSMSYLFLNRVLLARISIDFCNIFVSWLLFGSLCMSDSCFLCMSIQDAWLIFALVPCLSILGVVRVVWVEVLCSILIWFSMCSLYICILLLPFVVFSVGRDVFQPVLSLCCFCRLSLSF